MWKQSQWKGFVTSELDEKSKKQMKKDIEAEGYIYSVLNQVTLAGCDVKVAYDDGLGCYRAIVFGNNLGKDAGKAISGLGSDAINAVYVALWKATTMHELGAWPEAGQRFAIEL